MKKSIARASRAGEKLLLLPHSSGFSQKESSGYFSYIENSVNSIEVVHSDESSLWKAVIDGRTLYTATSKASVESFVNSQLEIISASITSGRKTYPMQLDGKQVGLLVLTKNGVTKFQIKMLPSKLQGKPYHFEPESLTILILRM